MLSRILLDLQSNDDPVWTYFDTHHKHILDAMNKTYRSSVGSVEGEPSGLSHPLVPEV